MPSSRSALKPLKGTRILSLSLNLPGPAALQRCRAMGAVCVKLEPPVRSAAVTAAPVGADPMLAYCPPAYEAMHQGVRCLVADLKSEAGQKVLQRELAKADILLTSFRPSGLAKLGLSWKALHTRYPTLTQVAIVGSPGARAEEPGHDLTYQAEYGLVNGLDLPPSLYADMGGSLMATEAVLQAVLDRQQQLARGCAPVALRGRYLEIALSNAARFLALPRAWGLSSNGADVGGGHAGYRVYACLDGRVAVAALEPHFAAALCRAAGVPLSASGQASATLMRSSSTRQALAAWLQDKRCSELQQIAAARDIPLHTLPA
jgi:crotonobetainyl-CoA:carnitine CoA-transferase CaiB-like acyl-CoA transferase